MNSSNGILNCLLLFHRLRKNNFFKMIERVSRKTKRGRIRIFSLSLINNQNLVSLKNPPSIEFNTSISVSFRVRVPSFQFILINIQKNQTNATSSRLIFGYQFCFFYFFLLLVGLFWCGEGNKTIKIVLSTVKRKKCKKYFQEIFSRKLNNVLDVGLCSRFTHSSYPLWRQQVHEASTKNLSH